MDNTAIRVENLSKRYRLGETLRYYTLRDQIAEHFRNLLKRETPADAQEYGTIWALKNVSFDVEQGEVIGIIGRNGAGKSTLLKILSRITKPTSGRAEVKGRVGSLLEVGTGFHPELTGRENIYMNAAILGMSRREIDRKLDEIIDFAEISEFIGTPVKRYSSGMQVRLAFAVAAHIEPEILIVDEVLAVGDVAFQKKCLGKMSSITGEGRTVLFVSHNMAAVRRLCTRTMLIKSGQIAMMGETEKVVARYLEEYADSSLYSFDIPMPRDRNAPGWAYQLTVEDGNGKPTKAIPIGKPWQVRIKFRMSRRTEHFIVGLGLSTMDEIPLRASWSHPCTIEPGEYEAVFREEDVLLGRGRYMLTLGLSSYERSFHYVHGAGFIEIAAVVEADGVLRASNAAVLNPMLSEIRRIRTENDPHEVNRL